MGEACNCRHRGDCDGSCTHPEPTGAQRIIDLRIALNDIIALDHHWHGPEGQATEIARAALLRDEDMKANGVYVAILSSPQTVAPTEEIAGLRAERDELSEAVDNLRRSNDEYLTELGRIIMSCPQGMRTSPASDGVKQLRAALTASEAEATSLRTIVSECAKALGNGAYIAPTCTIEFMGNLPDEIRLVVAELRRKLEEEQALREALKPFARADRAIGDEPGPFRFETGRGHRLVEREHFRAAARALSEREGQAE